MTVSDFSAMESREWELSVLFLSLVAGLKKIFFFNWGVVASQCCIAAAAAAAKLLQSCPTLCDPIDGSPPGSPIPGILQARTLEWVAISFFNA